MNADAFRHFFDYHFNENRTIWDTYIPSLSDEQFTQNVSYSHKSVRNQIVHLMSVDDTWFSGLRGVEISDSLDPATFVDRSSIRPGRSGRRDFVPEMRTVPFDRAGCS